ncbi:MAG: aminotransferase class I/II-fold pyridoxal phosphate-dependent enzyme [Candidatus Levyibacteriota bacterium]
MNIFNSLGSNYTARYVFSSLFTKQKNPREKLISFLEEKYEGQATLTPKGRIAIQIALENCGFKKGSTVAITGFTCVAVVDAVEKAGLTPVFLDIDPGTLHFTKKTLEEALEKEKGIKAVIIQNTLGFACGIEGIQEVCKKNKLVLLEDLAHSIGTTYASGVEAGTAGDFTILSFSQDKVIDAVSGGVLIVRNSKYSLDGRSEWRSNSDQAGTVSRDRFYPLLTFLIRKTYPLGFGKVLHKLFKSLRLLSDPMKINSDMTPWHAGLALSEFKRLLKQLAHRKKISQIYADNLNKKTVSSEINKHIESGTCLRFPIFIKDRDNLISFLKSKGVYISDIWYDAPVAPKKYKTSYIPGTCPKSETVSGQILNLPTHVNVSVKQAKEISTIINAWLK